MASIEGHPIPQDITGFQFRLIGDMTVKQFAYLACSLVLGWILFSLPLFLLLKIPLVALCVLTGVILAFIPIEGRPADTMLMLFFHALIKPNQFMYQKSDPTLATTITAQTPHAQEVKKEHEKKSEKVFFSTTPLSPNPNPVVDMPTPALQQQSQTPTVTSITTEPLHAAPQDLEHQEEALTKTTQELTEQINVVKKQEDTADPLLATQAHEKTQALQEQLDEIHIQKEALEKELIALKQKITQQGQQVFTPATIQQSQQTTRVKKIPATMKKVVGAPIVADFPNLITGIIKDPRGNVLTNILVEVKDKDDNPVRAFKTNALGQFASATPLLNGTYTVSFEDPNKTQRFDMVEITANGDIMDPLEVISIDAREDLRKSLFTPIQNL